ncbi:unnamed protein product [Discula destructiva]
MESLSETTWDVVICGTGLQQSLLALALSRSDKKILHIDPNDYYGGCEAAFSLQEADAWADAWAAEIATAKATATATASHPSSSSRSVFAAAAVSKPPADAPAVASPRSYALSLSPQLIHASSTLLSQLVSSRAYRQLEFLAVGSFFVLKKPVGAAEDGAPPEKPSLLLARIPSTREDVFSSTDLPARAKRQLIKFLKLVLSHDEDDEEAASRSQWEDFADRPLDDFLGADKMGFDAELRTYITTLTLSLDGRISTRVGLATIRRHLTSMGLFGPGFAAVYPKWGGGSEIAQVACRAGAVGGGIYMLGTSIAAVKNEGVGEELVELELSDGTVVKTKMLVRGSEEVPAADNTDAEITQSVTTVSRVIAVIDSPLSSLFEASVEGAPAPAVAVIALPSGSMKAAEGVGSTYPVYAIAHSSDTGECPTGQCVLYLTTIHTPDSKSLVDKALTSVLAALANEEGRVPLCLYQLYYEQRFSTDSKVVGEGRILNFGVPPVSLAFEDGMLEPVQQVWQKLTSEAAEDESIQYMVFTDREGVGDDEDFE